MQHVGKARNTMAERSGRWAAVKNAVQMRMRMRAFHKRGKPQRRRRRWHTF